MTTAAQDNQEATKPNQPYAKPEPDAFARILQSSGFGTHRSAEKILNEDLEELWEQKSEPVPAWLKPVTEKVELPESPFNTVNWLDEEPVPIKKETVEVECDLAVRIPRCLSPSGLTTKKAPETPKKETFLEWLEREGLLPVDGLPNVEEVVLEDSANEDEEQREEESLPEWLSTTYKNALKAKKDQLPDWMKEVDAGSTAPIWPDDEDVFNQNGLSNEAQEYIDPDETQKIKPVNRHEIQTDQLQPEKKPAKPTIRFINLDKHDKALLGLGAIGLYIVVFNMIGWAIPTGIDNIIIDVLGIYVYTTLADNGYDVRNLLPRKRK